MYERHVCPDCGITFSSRLRFESHLRANSQETFFNTFAKVAKTEKDQGRFETADAMIEARIQPRIDALTESRRFAGGYRNRKLNEPRQPEHINVKDN